MILIFSTSLFSAFDGPQVGARAVALSGAFCAISDNVTGIYYNPGGLGQLDNNQLFASFFSLYHNIDDYIYNGSLNISLFNINLGVMALGWYGLFTEPYQENTITFSYGNRILGLKDHRLYGGMNMKILHKSYKENDYTRFDPVFSSGLSKMGLSFDIGFLYSIFNQLNLGLAFLNVNEPDMGLEDESRVPLILQTGIAYDLKTLLLRRLKWFDRFRLTVNGKIREKEYRISSGLDLLFLNAININSGYSMGERRFEQVSFGFGFQKNYNYPSSIEKQVGDEDSYEIVEIEKTLRIIVNYAFVYYLNDAHLFTYGNHYIEVGITF